MRTCLGHSAQSAHEDDDSVAVEGARAQVDAAYAVPPLTLCPNYLHGSGLLACGLGLDRSRHRCRAVTQCSLDLLPSSEQGLLC